MDKYQYCFRQRPTLSRIHHHIKGNKSDNSIDNLELTNRKDHYKKYVVPLLEKRKEAEIAERIVSKIEDDAVKAFTLSFIVAGIILLVLGLLTQGKIYLWYLGLVLLISGISAFLY